MVKDRLRASDLSLLVTVRLAEDLAPHLRPHPAPVPASPLLDRVLLLFAVDQASPLLMVLVFALLVHRFRVLSRAAFRLTVHRLHLVRNSPLTSYHPPHLLPVLLSPPFRLDRLQDRPREPSLRLTFLVSTLRFLPLLRHRNVSRCLVRFSI